MKISATIVVSCIVILIASGSYAQDQLEPFPLDSHVSNLYGHMNFKIFTSCIVNENDQIGYDYEIKIEYTSDKRRLVSWDFVNFIFSQFPNAIKYSQHVSGNLLPLSVGDGSYIFSFTSEYLPLRFESYLQLFNLEDPDRIDRNKEGRVKFSGVIMNSYDFFSSELGLISNICLPSNLEVFLE